MSSNIFWIGGVKYKRSKKQGRKPSGLGKLKKYRLYLEDEERLKVLRDRFGYYYNENEIVRSAVKLYLDNYLNNSVPIELLIP